MCLIILVWGAQWKGAICDIMAKIWGYGYHLQKHWGFRLDTTTLRVILSVIPVPDQTPISFFKDIYKW